ncbi:MAG: PAS domain-containing protein [Fibrobacter sp.]|nr:PAS domain-containing protein [Fibrobacter sp.]
MQVPVGLLIAVSFVCFLVITAFVISVLLIRDLLNKQKIYSNFAGYLSDFLVIISKEGRLIDASPTYISDPLYDQILRQKSFKRVFSAAEFKRFSEYVRGLDAYPDIPFVFSQDMGDGLNWYEIRARQKQGGDVHMVLLLKNVTLDVESRTQRDELKEKVDMLLQSTGDFLWSMDVDSRTFTFLTPLVDDEGRAIPRSQGVQDIRAMMPEEDYAFFDKQLNARIVEFRAKGQDSGENRGVRLRLMGEDGKLDWYAFCGRLYTEENAKIVFRGSARKLDLQLEKLITEDPSVSESTQVAALAFPDIRLFWIDREYKICGCNQAFSLAFGSPIPKEIEGKRLLEVVRPRYFSLFHGVLSEVFEKGLSKSWKGPFGAGRRLLWFNAVPLKRDDGYTYRVLGVYLQLDENDFNVDHSTMEKK